MPNQKFGIAMPIWLNAMTPQSPGRLCRFAASIPNGMAIAVDIASARKVSGRVTAIRSAISFSTGTSYV